MKYTTLAAMAVFFVFGLCPAHASLGDTEAQCIGKYGAEFDAKDGLGYDVVGDRAASFRFKNAVGALNRRVIFLRGLVVHEEISSSDPSLPLSKPQMQAILESDGAGRAWHKGDAHFRTDNSGSSYGAETWSRDDGAQAKFWLTAKAGSQKETGQMEISSRSYLAAKAYFDKQDGTN